VELAGENRSGFEFQRLFGMGQQLGDRLLTQEKVPVTFYAPVGSYEDLLPYLVRRMLENGANTSFVSQIRDPAIAPQTLARDVVGLVRSAQAKPDPLPLPAYLYGTERLNSRGFDLSRTAERRTFYAALPEKIGGAIKPSPSIAHCFVVA
jgi:RHH-type proline utilization regulon transcriptional repressor/proline dehydrogenase/delta 1-pyrroline-5-carboxylate dehydrogenase